MPCTPNPTTGFFFYVLRRDVLELAISVEDAAKLLMSAGMIQPGGGADQQKKLAALAETATRRPRNAAAECIVRDAPLARRRMRNRDRASSACVAANASRVRQRASCIQSSVTPPSSRIASSRSNR